MPQCHWKAVAWQTWPLMPQALQPKTRGLASQWHDQWLVLGTILLGHALGAMALAMTMVDMTMTSQQCLTTMAMTMTMLAMTRE